MAKKSFATLAVLSLLNPDYALASQKRQLEPNFKHFTQDPMIENYKKKNVPVPVESRNCQAMVGAAHQDHHSHDVGAGACKAFCLF